MPRLLPLAPIALFVALAASPGAAPAARQAPAALDRAIDAVFDAVHNLDYAEARRLAREAIALAPEEPRAHRALASVAWLEISFLRGAVTVDHYMGGLTKSKDSLPRPPAALAAEFEAALDRSRELAQARLRRNPLDLEARTDVGVAYALQASFAASVHGSMTSALGAAKRAYDAHEYVLARDAGRSSALFAVGIYRYMVATLSLPKRLLAYLVGFGGGRERGIGMVEAAARDPRMRVDAATALILIYSREGRHADALPLVRELAARFPRNRLLVLEEGSTALRAGRPREAADALARGLALSAGDTRPRIPGERALWLYKRGAVRLALGSADAAVEDLDAALDAAPVEWVRGRIHLELGKAADLAGRRPDAVARYRLAWAVCQRNSDPVCADEASRLSRRPFARGAESR